MYVALFGVVLVSFVLLRLFVLLCVVCCCVMFAAVVMLWFCNVSVCASCFGVRALFVLFGYVGCASSVVCLSLLFCDGMRSRFVLCALRFGLCFLFGSVSFRAVSFHSVLWCLRLLCCVVLHSCCCVVLVFGCIV